MRDAQFRVRTSIPVYSSIRKQCKSQSGKAIITTRVGVSPRRRGPLTTSAIKFCPASLSYPACEVVQYFSPPQIIQVYRLPYHCQQIPDLRYSLFGEGIAQKSSPAFNVQVCSLVWRSNYAAISEQYDVHSKPKHSRRKRSCFHSHITFVFGVNCRFRRTCDKSNFLFGNKIKKYKAAFAERLKRRTKIPKNTR